MAADVGTIRDFHLPDLGEGLEEGEIVAWHVEVGDEVELNQQIAEIETAKALVAIPCPFAGVVVERLGEVGTSMEVGSVLVRIRTGEAGDDSGPGDDAQPAAGGAQASPRESDDDVEPTPLVGYGRDTETSRRSRTSPRNGHTGRVLAKPPVRKLARALGVDLADVEPSGAGGVVTRHDVEAAARLVGTGAGGGGSQGAGAGESRREPIRSDVGSTSTSLAAPRALGIGFRGRRPGEIEPIRSVRKRIVEKMELSRRDIPAASCTVDVDVTRLWTLRHDLTDAARRDGWDVKITPFAVLMRATILGLRRFPTLNARLVGRDPQRGEHGEIHLLEDINLGFAVDTDRGLVVPNIKHADTKSLIELATELANLSAAARDGRIDPAAVTGGTFTVNNYGVFGNDDGDPIINHPEAGILGMGAIRERPWVVDGQIAVRRIARMRLSFDHRVCDGAEGGRFLTYVAALCEEPSRILLHG